MKITREWLENNNACEEGIKCWEENGCIEDPVKIIEKAVEINELKHASWFTTRVLSEHQNVKYAVFAARQVLYLFEEQFPDDDRVRVAIEAAEQYIVSDDKDKAIRNVYIVSRDAFNATDNALDKLDYDSEAYLSARCASNAVLATYYKDSVYFNRTIKYAICAGSNDSSIIKNIVNYALELLKSLQGG